MPSIGDQAIKTAADDRLDREQFAADVAQSIRSIDSSQGYVFGLLGPWGSGKTSLGNLIVEKLQQEPAIPVVEFNPWLFAGTESLIDSFFKELSAQLRLKNPARYSNLADQIDRYSQLLTPLTWIPVIGPWAGRIKTLAGVAKSLQSNRKDSVQEQRTKLSNALAGNASPILVLIDDIDRLSRREVQDIFRLVRLTASFPNIIYLLAFDRERVEAALCEEGMPGRSYLEKIIQTVWDVPVVPHHILLEQLVDALNQSLKDVANFEHFDDTRWPDTLAEIISPLISNMRDAKRYAASIPAAVSALQHQVDLGDILALEAMRIFLPDTFAAMARAQMALTSPAPHFGTNQENPAFKAQVDELLSLNEDKRDVVRAALRRLFPASVRHFENSSYGPEWRRVWLKERRVANADILAHYFARTTPAGLSAFNDAERAVDLVRDPASFREVLGALDPTRLRDLISALEDFEGEFPIDGLDAAIATLLNFIPRLPEPEQGLLSIGSSFLVSRVVLRMLRQYDGPERTQRAVEKILPDLESLSAERELIDLIGHLEGAGHKLVPEEVAQKFQMQFLAKLRGASLEQLEREYDLASVLLAPKHYANDPVFRVPVGAAPELHLAVFRAFTSEIRRQGFGDRAVRRVPTLSWDILMDIYGDEETIQKVIDTARDADTDGSDATIELVEKYLSGWRPPAFGQGND